MCFPQHGAETDKRNSENNRIMPTTMSCNGLPLQSEGTVQPSPFHPKWAPEHWRCPRSASMHPCVTAGRTVRGRGSSTRVSTVSCPADALAHVLCCHPPKWVGPKQERIWHFSPDTRPTVSCMFCMGRDQVRKQDSTTAQHSTAAISRSLSLSLSLSLRLYLSLSVSLSLSSVVAVAGKMKPNSSWRCLGSKWYRGFRV